MAGDVTIKVNVFSAHCKYYTNLTTLVSVFLCYFYKMKNKTKVLINLKMLCDLIVL